MSEAEPFTFINSKSGEDGWIGNRLLHNFVRWLLEVIFSRFKTDNLCV